MSILEKIKGNDSLDAVITFKINSDDKEDLIKFCREHKISIGKLVREGLDKIVKEIEEELNK